MKNSKNSKNLLKIITCAFFISGYNKTKFIQNQQHEQQNQHNKLTSYFNTLISIKIG